MIWLYGIGCYVFFTLLVASRLRIRALEQENHDLWGVVLKGVVPSKDAA